MSTTEAILQNAAYHAQLLAAIAELDYVPSALEHQTSYLANIEKNKQQTSAKIKLLEKKTNKERKEHEALRDSTARRLAAKLTGRKEKFEAKASKEEREYVEALDQEIQEKRSLETLDELRVAGNKVLADLQGKEERYKLTKQDLADLYRKIFDGPTQAYPEDDRLEQQLAQVQGRYNAIQGFLNQESQAVNLLKLANSTLIQCSSKMQEALSYSQFDMFGGGGVADMMERNALSAAEGLSNQAATLVQQAMFASPQVQPIGEVRIAHGSIISDVLFDNIFTDMAFHDKIKASARNVQAVQYNLTNQLAAAKARTAAIGEDLRSAADDLTRARGALDSFRRSVFDSLSGNIPPLPAYDAPAGPPPGHPAAQVTMPDASSSVTMPDASSYAPPAPPKSSGYTPLTSNYTPPATSYAPPQGPPPGVQAISPPPLAAGSSSSPAPPSSPPPGATWGSRNPYAAALAAGPQSPYSVTLPAVSEKSADRTAEKS